MNTIQTSLITILVCLVFVWTGFAAVYALPDTHLSASLPAKEIDEYIQGQMRANQIPGIALVIVQDGATVYSRGYGEAGAGRAMTETTPMFIGSVSKSFTAVAVMQLVESGKVNLDAPIQTYLPWFTLADTNAAANITVRHLLNQTSGLTAASLPMDEVPDSASLREATERLSSAILMTEPGATFSYCNHNYTILGMLVETVSGKPFDRYIREQIFVPLGMKQSFTSKAEAEQAGLAQGYNHILGFPVARPQPQPQWDLPAGYLISTAGDMGKYLSFQLGDTGAGLLSAESLKVLHTPPAGIETTYAMGWYQNQRAGIATLEHAGDVNVFHSAAVLIPERNITFALLFNLNGILQVATTYNTIPTGLVSLLTDQKPEQGFPLWLSYLILAIVFLADIGRKGVALFHISTWGKKALEKGTSKVLFNVGSEFVVSLFLLIGLPYIVFRQAGMTALKITLGYHTDIVVFIAVTALLSLGLSIGRIIWITRKSSA